MSIENLLKEFPPVSTQAWENAIRKDLKGADYAKKLIWQSEEGLEVKPYYRAEDVADIEYLNAAPGDFPYVRGTTSAGSWNIGEEVDLLDMENANRVACDAIAAGAEEISFRNVVIENPSDIGILLSNLQGFSVHFETADVRLVSLLIERLKQREETARISTGWDPNANPDFAREVLATASKELRPFTIHGEQFEESGATAIEEIGFTLAAAVEFLAAMQARGADANRAATSLSFSFAIGANYFFQIAKLRAFRALWAQVVESFGGSRDCAKACIRTRTSRWNKTIYDPHVNVLRATTEAMSAVLGGADSIFVAPFDEPYKNPDAASRRLARNTLIILKHEANLSDVADPGGGAYYLEFITDFIAREAWQMMQRIEASGGYQQGVAEGRVALALQKPLTTRDNAVSTRRRIFTGTNQFADPSERALDRIEESRVEAGTRGAQKYEELRLRTERHEAKGGRRPRVLLAQIGDAKMRAARSNFAANFFACAGFEIVAQRFSSAGEIADAEADLAVVCSSDPEYVDLVAELMPRLKARDRTMPVLIAGYPDSAERLRELGVAGYVHIRSNPIELLTEWQRRLGMKD
jgi:methylmalonyl-CoA mutase